MNQPAIEIRGAVKRFGTIRALDGVDLEIRKGEIFGLIGHNGAGKSTLFKLMLGLLPLDGGEILIQGRALRGGGFRTLRRRIGYLPENVALYDNLTGIETLRFFAALKGADQHTCATALERVGLGHAAGRRVRGYSKGMRQRLGFAQALLGQPDTLFLDEPSNGLDPEGIRAFYTMLEALRDAGTTVVISSHILAELQERVDRLAILRAGRVEAVGTLQTLRRARPLPLRLRVQVRDGQMAAVRAVLQPFAVDGLQTTDEEITLRCRREDKMAVLAALTALGERVRDVLMQEPSLEELFLGYGAHR